MVPLEPNASKKTHHNFRCRLFICSTMSHLIHQCWPSHYNTSLDPASKQPLSLLTCHLANQNVTKKKAQPDGLTNTTIRLQSKQGPTSNADRQTFQGGAGWSSEV